MVGNRRYAKVSFMNYSEIGLLDTGANVCIGSTLEKESFTNFSNYKAITLHVRTADARLHSVYEILKVLMRYKAKEKVLDLYAISSISQRLILGIDFWRVFSLASYILCFINCLDSKTPRSWEISIRYPNFSVDNLKPSWKCFQILNAKGLAVLIE